MPPAERESQLSSGGSGLPVIRVGDKTTHGGFVIEGIDDFKIDGVPVSGVGHKVVCPRCFGVHQIAEGSARTVVHGIPIATESMKTTCGALLIASQKRFCLDPSTILTSRTGQAA
nr:PAAR domain-containing protein [Variovorax sp. dw_954]